jgi:hypothetical protein
MRRPAPGGITLVLAVVLGLAACGDDGIRPQTGLTTQEAEQVAEAVAQQTGFFGLSGGAASVQPDLAPADGTAEQSSTSFEFETSCPGGGSVIFSGTLTADEGASTSSLDGELDFDDCTRTTSEGSTVTLTTQPVFDWTSTFEFVSESEFQMDSSLGGDFDWQLDDKSGSCGLALETSLNVSATEGGGSATVSGSTTGEVCGVEVDDSFETTVTTSA